MNIRGYICTCLALFFIFDFIRLLKYQILQFHAFFFILPPQGPGRTTPTAMSTSKTAFDMIAAERAPSDASAPARHPAAEQAASAETGHPAAAETAPDFETYTAVVQALMSCQERINNYRRMITELTEVLEKLESLNGYYLSCIIARETRQTKE